MYNKDKKNTGTITPSTDFESKWKEKNQELFKYAGDGAKKSVDKGLKETHDYMRDADERTRFEEVQTASVKRHLANDANDDKLYNAAMMELIGHLSKDNKEDYLKHAQPLQKYIDVKDEFDFKHNNYTTTESIDTTPDEKVRQLQRELNEAGYTDKMGQPIKDDGVYAGKTAYADDSKKANDMVNTSQRVGNRANLPSRGQAVSTNSSDTKTEWSNPEIKSLSNQYTDEELNKLKEDGILPKEDEHRNTLKKTMIKRLSANWWYNHGNDENQKKIATIGDKLRKFDDNNFTKAYYLNSSTSAGTMGHNAIMLMNKDGYAMVFSFYPRSENLIDSFDTEAEMRFSVLTPNQANRTLNQDGYIFSMSASDGAIKTENYNRYLEFDISNGQGYNMYYKAVNLYSDPGVYELLGRQCDDIACEIMNFGGIDIDAKNIPNISFKHKENEILLDTIWKTIKETWN